MSIGRLCQEAYARTGSAVRASSIKAIAVIAPSEQNVRVRVGVIGSSFKGGKSVSGGAGGVVTIRPVRGRVLKKPSKRSHIAIKRAGGSRQIAWLTVLLVAHP